MMATFHCYFFSCFHFYIAYPSSKRPSQISNMKYKHCYIPLEIKIFTNFVSPFPLIPLWLLLCLGSLIIIPAARQNLFSLGLNLLSISMSSFLFSLLFSLCSPAAWYQPFNLDCIDKNGDFNCICRNKVGSLACVRCLSKSSFANVHILQLSTSNEDVTLNSLFICLPKRKLQEKRSSFAYNLSHFVGFVWNVITWISLDLNQTRERKSVPSFSYHAHNLYQKGLYTLSVHGTVLVTYFSHTWV